MQRDTSGITERFVLRLSGIGIRWRKGGDAQSRYTEKNLSNFVSGAVTIFGSDFLCDIGIKDDTKFAKNCGYYKRSLSVLPRKHLTLLAKNAQNPYSLLVDLSLQMRKTPIK